MESIESFTVLRYDDDPFKSWRAEEMVRVVFSGHLLTGGSHSHHSEDPEGQKQNQKTFSEDSRLKQVDICVRVWGIYAGSLAIINKIPFPLPKSHSLSKHGTL